MKNRKKEITLLVIAILVIVSMIAGATYAFFKAQIGPDANFDINATTSTTDNLTFSTEGDIVLNVTAENLGREKGDLSDTAIARARLIKSNTSESATAYYNIYLLIEENEMEYSSYTKEGADNLIFMNKEKKEETDLTGYTGVPELILSVKKGETEHKITKRLTPTDGGYDITEADGLYAIGENVEITTTSDKIDEWEVKVTFKNLEYNQQLNTGKSLKGKIIITAEKLLYEINDAAELRQLSEEVNAGDTKEGKYYVLTNNIDLGEHQEGVSNFTPIGKIALKEDLLEKSFKGNFNGDNHTISNLYINEKSENGSDMIPLGVFGRTEGNIIKNLTVRGDIITNQRSMSGGIVGFTVDTTLENCINYVNVTNTVGSMGAGGIIGLPTGNTIIKNSMNYGIINGANATGGIAGYAGTDSTIFIIDSINKGSVKNDYGSSSIGGIIGSSDKLVDTSPGEIIIKNSKNEGNLIIDSTKAFNGIGGLVGYSQGPLTIEDSENDGKVILNTSLDNTLSVGGIVGQITAEANIENCKNNNEIKIDRTNFDKFVSYNIGGIVGLNRGNTTIIKSTNNGNITNGTYIGGIVGYSNIKNSILTIDKCVNNGLIDNYNLSFTDSTRSPNTETGGIAGYISYTKGIIINTQNYGEIRGFDSSSGIIGLSFDNIAIINCNNLGDLYNNTVSNSSKKSVILGLGFFSAAINNYGGTLENPYTVKAYINNAFNTGNTHGIIANFDTKISEYTNFIKDINNIYYLTGSANSATNDDSSYKKYFSEKTELDMKSQSFVDELNNNIKSINLEEIDPILKDYTLVNWKLGENGYPTLNF